MNDNTAFGKGTPLEDTQGMTQRISGSCLNVREYSPVKPNAKAEFESQSRVWPETLSYLNEGMNE